MKPIKVGLLGLGTVGTGVARIIEAHQEDLQRQIGVPVVIEKVLVRNIEKARTVSLDVSKLTENVQEIINDPEIDVVIEVMGGVDYAKECILAAIAHGKHVVTANKDLMALYGQEILTKAVENSCDVFYEASVAGGIPIIRTLQDGFSSDRIVSMMGIVNGTTNFILSKMSAEDASYEEVLQEAQELGYAEADPTADVEGLDAARKMTILGTLGFRTKVDLEDVKVRGISDVTKEDILYGKRLGYEVKLLGIAEQHDDAIHLSVEPTMVKRTHPLASVNGVFNAVYVYGEAVGETMFYGPGAGELPTAMSVVADLVQLGKNIGLGTTGKSIFLPYKEKKIQPDEQIASKYFLLLYVADEPGVLAQIANVFAEFGVSLDSVLQQPNSENPDAEIIIITHDSNKAAMNYVLEKLEDLSVVKKIKSIYRVIES